MKIAVFGFGSIGRRHARNLRALGCEQIRIIESATQNRETAKAEGWRLMDESELAEYHPDLTVIATPAVNHLAHAKAAQASAALFIEKPLSHSSEGLDAFIAESSERGQPVFVAANMRFHPGPAALKQASEADRVGKILSARFEVGSYLPDWRPGTDFRQSVSALPELGGGVLLEHIHEIDIAHWFCGSPDQVFAATRAGKTLGIPGEELCEAVLRYSDGRLVSLHQDFVQRFRQRRYELIGERGTLGWDARTQKAWCYDAETNTETVLWQDSQFEVNSMYLAQFVWLVNQLKSGRPFSRESLYSGVAAVRTVEALRRSASKGTWIVPDETPHQSRTAACLQ